MKFNELYVNPEGTLLVIEVQCTDTEDTYPRQIMIDSQDTYLEGNPSSSPVYQSINYTESKVFRLEIPRESLDISDNLLFVYCRSSKDDIIMCPVCNFFRIPKFHTIHKSYWNIMLLPPESVYRLYPKI